MLEGYGEILIDSATDIPAIRTIEYIMWFSRANFIQEKPDLVERLTRALGRATKLMQADSATARDAFFAQMAAKAFGAKTDPKLAELQWNNMRSYFATGLATPEEGMAALWKWMCSLGQGGSDETDHSASDTASP